MQSETKNCQNCKNDFSITPDDFGFYEKIKVPPPTFCPECRLQRRLAWRNDLSFYNRTCDMCGKDIISLYHKDKNLTVFCNRCWWSDKWDPKSYARDFDFSRPFFEQFRELQDQVPLLSLINDDGVGSVNCEYTQNVTFAKNCYMVSMSWYSEDVMYSYSVAGPETRDVMDSLNLFYNSQIIYDSIFVESCYNCRSCWYSTGLNDCILCVDSKGCSDCFMCVNLRQKKYCFQNKQYTKEEYEKIVESYHLDTHSGTERAKKEFAEFLVKQIRRYAYVVNSVNSTGDLLMDCKNVKDSLVARNSENVRFMLIGGDVKDGYDLTPAGKCEECYEGLTPDHDYRALFSIFSLKNQEVSYVENCHSSKHLFGCSGIKHGQYCILNKQYSKEGYFELRDKLIEHMKDTGEYGEFFPSEMSNFGYNETMAQEYFPLTKEEAISKGFKWWDKLQKTIGKATIAWRDVPDSILDVEDSILNQTLACEKCERNYKIVPNELTFYRKHGIPVPRKCFFCRTSERIKLQSPNKLWHRQCMKVGCENQFQTSYAPDRPELVYCEKCYQQEVY